MCISENQFLHPVFISVSKPNIFLELDYSVAQQPHMYPPVAQNSPFPPSQRTKEMVNYALPHTFAYQISKESTMFAE
jgi:hypothetical protein